MIAFVQGPLVELEPTHAVVDCSGVGYRVRISLNTYAAIQGKEKIRLLTHFMVREDAQLLYGFVEKQEQHLFELLIGISGVGGNTALMVLSSLSPADLLQAIAQEDVAALKRVKGIGAKTAGRIVLELKDKIQDTDLAGASQTLAPVGKQAQKQEAAAALLSLGFGKADINKRLDKILADAAEDLTVEQLIKRALRNG